MARCQLRVYHGPENTTLPRIDEIPASGQGHNITVSVGDVIPLLADAVASERTWLRDFSNDDITISTDLYEVLLAYRHFRRPGA